MSECKHTNIILLVQNPCERLRCRHCHLTIKAEELDGEYCPECLAVSGQKRNDFEKLEPVKRAPVQYRCEDCGAMLNPKTS